MKEAERLQIEAGGVAVEDLAAFLADDHHIFQTDTAPIGQIEARFNRDDHAGLQLFATTR